MGLNTDRIGDLMFLDFEASSLSKSSWPIEVGIAWFSLGGQLRSASRLIRPESFWDESDWSPEAGAVHGISRDELEAADSAPLVADWLMSAIKGKKLVSDFPEYEARWLRKLLRSSTKACLETPWIHSNMDVLMDRYSWDVAEAYYTNPPFPAEKPHRAGRDAMILGKSFIQAEAWQYSFDRGSFRPSNDDTHPQKNKRRLAV